MYKIYDVREQNGVRQICYGNQQVSEEKLKNDLEQICEYYERSLSLLGVGAAFKVAMLAVIRGAA